MRAFVLLLLGGGLIWAVLAFFPNSDEVEAGGPGGSDNGAVVDEGFEQPRTQPDPVAPVDQDRPVEVKRENTPKVPNPAIKASGGSDLPIGRMDEIEIGSLVLHSGPAQVRDWIAASDGLLGADLEHGVMAFSLAVAGQRAKARAEWKEIDDVNALGPGIKWMLTRALTGDIEGAWPAKLVASNPLEHGMALGLQAFEARTWLAAKEHARAAELISRVLIGELDSPWPADMASMAMWSETCRAAQSGHRWHSKGVWPSIDMEVMGGDSLTLLRKRFVDQNPGATMSTGLMQKANGMSTDVIHPGQILRVPSEPVTCLVDLGDHWLLYMIGGEVVESWMVGVGREGDETITGDFVVGDKQYEPTWWPKGRDPIYYGDPENPLGTRYIIWMEDGEKTAYGFHGTWKPESIGKNESDGCIRMNNKDVEELTRILPVGSTFTVRF